MRPVKQRANEILSRLSGMKSKEMVEVGVHRGECAQLLLEGSPDVIYTGVDSWLCATDQPQRYTDTADPLSLLTQEDQDRNMQEAMNRLRKHIHRATLIVSHSRDASMGMDDGSLSLVFLDGDHSYRGVKEDIVAWLPKVRSGGWIGGHDYGYTPHGMTFGVDEAVNECFGKDIELGANYTWWRRC